MKKLFSFLVMVCFAACLCASNIITYTASAKLEEQATAAQEGLHVNAFNVEIVSHTFADGMGTITFADEVTTIGEDAFLGCSSLTSITIPDAVTLIGDRAFEECRNLSSVVIPDSVVTIGSYAFCLCEKMTSATIGNSVTEIKEKAFFECFNLQSVIIPASVKTIGEYAFDFCNRLWDVYCYATVPPAAQTTSFGNYSACLHSVLSVG